MNRGQENRLFAVLFFFIIPTAICFIVFVGFFMCLDYLRNNYSGEGATCRVIGENVVACLYDEKNDL